jgi:hypothetical protein
MKKAYNEQRAVMGKIGVVIEKANETNVALNAQSFNRWAIVKKENVKSTIDGDKIKIELNNIPEMHRGKKLSIHLESLNGDRIQTVDGVGDYLNYEPQKTIVWRYAVDGVLKNNASSNERLRIQVYTMGNMPHKSSGILWGSVTSGIGVGGIVYSFIVRSNALADYTLYDQNKKESADFYKTPNISREDLYQKANNAYIQSQTILGIGLVVAALGVLIIRKGVKVNQDARNLGFAMASDKRKWFFEPMAATNDFGQSSVGLRLRF